MEKWSLRGSCLLERLGSGRIASRSPVAYVCQEFSPTTYDFSPTALQYTTEIRPQSETVRRTGAARIGQLPRFAGYRLSIIC